MKIKFSSYYKEDREALIECVNNFDISGKKFDDRNRNSLKIFEVNGQLVNIKSFKTPNIINQVVYRTIRSSKAHRSFENANKLLCKGVLTPKPIAYFEEEGFFFGKSYYVSEHLQYDLTFRELCHDSSYIGNEEMLSAVALFTYSLHEKNIHFLDHSPGNTLIKIKEEGFDFYLVDLNRMKFRRMDFKTRMDNFARLSHRTCDIAIMARAYAIASGESQEVVYNAITLAVQAFQKNIFKKKQIKTRLKFWKK